MLVEPSNYSPLKEFLDYIPECGLVISLSHIQDLARIFVKGGVICQTINDVLLVLEKLEEYYGLVSITEEPDRYILRKNNGN